MYQIKYVTWRLLFLVKTTIIYWRAWHIEHNIAYLHSTAKHNMPKFKKEKKERLPNPWPTTMALCAWDSHPNVMASRIKADILKFEKCPNFTIHTNFTISKFTIFIMGNFHKNVFTMLNWEKAFSKVLLFTVPLNILVIMFFTVKLCHHCQPQSQISLISLVSTEETKSSNLWETVATVPLQKPLLAKAGSSWTVAHIKTLSHPSRMKVDGGFINGGHTDVCLYLQCNVNILTGPGGKCGNGGYSSSREIHKLHVVPWMGYNLFLHM